MKSDVKIKVLIIDDDEVSIKGIRDHCEDEGWKCRVSDFDKSYKQIMQWNPDVVILDLCEAGADAGTPVLDSIWMNGYRPIVIFSGNIDSVTLKEEYNANELIQKYSKGDEQPVNDFLDEYKEFFCVLSEYRDDLGKSLIQAFDGVKSIKENREPDLNNDIVKYLLAKRTVNYFDLERKDITLPPWGMYLYPPILNNSLSTCDILRKVNSETDLSEIGSPDEYLLVLTPSCDLYNEGEREAKVQEILCAKCFEKKVFADGTTNAGKIKKILHAGINKQWVPLPAYKNVCPALTVDMKKLEIISLDKVKMNKNDIKDDNTYYLRLCSIDSPFREQIIWNYMQTSCRPGVPDRNMDNWAEDIKN